MPQNYNFMIKLPEVMVTHFSSFFFPGKWQLFGVNGSMSVVSLGTGGTATCN